MGWVHMEILFSDFIFQFWFIYFLLLLPISVSDFGKLMSDSNFGLWPVYIIGVIGIEMESNYFNDGMCENRP